MKLNSAKVIDTALSLMESERSEAFIDEFHRGLLGAVEKTKGYAIANIESAVPLSATEQKLLEHELTAILRHKMEVKYRLRPELIGGFRVTVGDWKLDATTLSELNRLAESIRKIT